MKRYYCVCAFCALYLSLIHISVLKEMLKKVEPHGIKLSLEFCGAPGMSINRFEDAYAIVEEVGSPLVGITLDQYHFHAMASDWAALEKADGKKIFG